MSVNFCPSAKSVIPVAYRVLAENYYLPPDEHLNRAWLCLYGIRSALLFSGNPVCPRDIVAISDLMNDVSALAHALDLGLTAKP